jgi:hypothetical protein
MGRFAAWHRRDRSFALAFVVVAWVSVFFGFYPSVSARWNGTADYVAPLILQAHVFAFAGWLGLLTIQVLLIRTGRLSWHRTLGVVGALLIPILIVTGLGAEIYSQRFYSPDNAENLRFFAVPVMTMLSFAVAASLAVWWRADAAAHKRLIMLATALVLIAAYTRWWGGAIGTVLGDTFFGTLVVNAIGPDLIIAAMIAYDLATRGRVHRVLAIGAPLVVAGQIAQTFAYHSDWWPRLVRWLIGI